MNRFKLRVYCLLVLLLVPCSELHPTHEIQEKLKYPWPSPTNKPLAIYAVSLTSGLLRCHEFVFTIFWSICLD